MAYVKYNINPLGKLTGDCSIRAVAVATGLSWDKAFEGLTVSAFKLKTVPDATEAVQDFLLSLGFEVGKINVSKGSKRQTVAQFAESHPNMYCVLRVAGHLVACGRGNYVDTWDSGDKAVYKYWYKPIL